MTEDLTRNHNCDAAMNIALNDINTILLENGTNCGAIDLPIPIDNELYLNDVPNLEEFDLEKLNNEQRELVDSVLQAMEVIHHSLDIFYAGAPGKAFFFNKIAMYLLKMAIRSPVLHGVQFQPHF